MVELTPARFRMSSNTHQTDATSSGWEDEKMSGSARDSSATTEVRSKAAMALLAELAVIPQVVGYDHRIAELDTAEPRLIEWSPGWGWTASKAGRELLQSSPSTRFMTEAYVASFAA